MTTVIIAAHDEEAVLGACLDAVLRDGCVAPADVIVSANGCTDDTAAVALERGVRVVDRADAGKADALNAAEAIADSFPRIYLDADIRVPPGTLSTLESMLTRPGTLIAVPRRRVVTAGRPWPVRAYFAINTRLPVFDSGVFGRGVIAVSAEGRARFGLFPPVVADDLFLDAQFADREKAVADVEVDVAAPYTTRALVERLIRVRRGNSQLRAQSRSGGITGTVRPTGRWDWLRIVARNPRLIAAVAPYVAITLLAARGASRSGSTVAWSSDATTRAVVA